MERDHHARPFVCDVARDRGAPRRELAEQRLHRRGQDGDVVAYERWGAVDPARLMEMFPLECYQECRPHMPPHHSRPRVSGLGSVVDRRRYKLLC